MYPKMSLMKLNTFESMVNCQQQYLVYSKNGEENTKKLAALSKRMHKSLSRGATQQNLTTLLCL